jgi:hypothetical protein
MGLPMATGPQSTASSDPTIHKAERATDGSGAVEWWDVLNDQQAVARRQQGLDIVVRGPDKTANGEKAKKLRRLWGHGSVTGWHARQGPLSLPHYQQDLPPDERPLVLRGGHSKSQEEAMKYMTHELFVRMQSENEEVAEAALDQWERACEA